MSWGQVLCKYIDIIISWNVNLSFIRQGPLLYRAEYESELLGLTANCWKYSEHVLEEALSLALDTLPNCYVSQLYLYNDRFGKICFRISFDKSLWSDILIELLDWPLRVWWTANPTINLLDSFPILSRISPPLPTLHSPPQTQYLLTLVTCLTYMLWFEGCQNASFCHIYAPLDFSPVMTLKPVIKMKRMRVKHTPLLLIVSD